MQKTGLVLAGGGGKGAYEIGVWKALEEFNLVRNITAVSGTSVGALNAALFAQGDYETAKCVWSNITRDKILELGSSGTALSSQDGLERLIDKYLDCSYVSRSNMPCYVTCKTNGRVEYINLQGRNVRDIKSYLLASTAIPFIYPKVSIYGKSYVDGGVFGGDNIPIAPLYRRLGYRTFIAVALDRSAFIDPEKNFSGAKIYSIFPTKDQGGIFRGTLDFTPEGVSERIEQGYNDACEILNPIYSVIKNQVKAFQLLDSLSGIKWD